jgi:hypothetical protein
VVEKRKRSIQNWWNSLESFDIFTGLISLFLLTAGVWFVAWLIHEAHMDTTAACEYFVNYDVEDIPARCLAYFTGAGQ